MHNNKHIYLKAGAAPWYHYPCTQHVKETIHFSPANGILADSYREFYKALTPEYTISAMDCRAAWPNVAPPKESQNWDTLANDLIEAVSSQYNRPVIGMGHSLGGVLTLMAAIKKPELFSKIVVIEGASLPNYWLSLVYDYLPRKWVANWLPLVGKTYNRRVVWPDRQRFAEYHLGKSVYKNFSHQCMQDYAEAALKPTVDGRYELVYNREWEAFIFRRIKYLWSVAKKVKVPVLLIRAEHGNLYTQQQFDERCAKLPSHIETAVLPQLGHLPTHEDPVATAALIKPYLERPY